MEPPPLPSATRWWTGWLVVVFGGPLASYGFLLAKPEEPGPTLLLMMGCALANIATSIGLAKRIAAKRLAGGGSANATGLTLGLLFGGWAVMMALFCGGCAVQLQLNLH